VVAEERVTAVALVELVVLVVVALEIGVTFLKLKVVWLIQVAVLVVWLLEHLQMEEAEL
jgi:hypothetical protein